ncbi:MAG: hypothetical protein KY476_27110, partial [Planctomycetes bacterium]|nr:hypothetical protein [Planctomycetota bacterium]
MTSHNVVPSRRAWTSVFALAASTFVAAGPAEAQSARELAPRDEVREATREILASPEFRNFRRLEGSGSSSGGDSSGDWSEGSQRAPRGGEAGRRQAGTKRSTSNANSDPNEHPWADGWRGGAEGRRDSIEPDQASQQRPGNAAAEGTESRETSQPAAPPLRGRSEPFGDGWRGGSGSREQFARDFRSSSGNGGTRSAGRGGGERGRSGSRSAPRSSADSSASQGRSAPPSSPSSAPVSSA